MTSVIESFDAFVHHRHHDDQDAAPATATTEPENHMASKLAEAATALAALAGNPLIDAIAEAGAGKLLTPGEITFITGLIASFEHERARAPQPVQPAQPVQ